MKYLFCIFTVLSSLTLTAQYSCQNKDTQDLNFVWVDPEEVESVDFVITIADKLNDVNYHLTKANLETPKGITYYLDQYGAPQTTIDVSEIYVGITYEICFDINLHIDNNLNELDNHYKCFYVDGIKPIPTNLKRP